jgi:hypothetical protein
MKTNWGEIPDDLARTLLEQDARAKPIATKAQQKANFNKNTKRKPPDKSDKGQGRNRLFDAACEAQGLPLPVYEYYFALPRKWRFDYCWAEYDLAVEKQGGNFKGGRHSRGAALRKEYEKLNAAASAGWYTIFVLPEQVESGEIFAIVKHFIKEHGYVCDPC